MPTRRGRAGDTHVLLVVTDTGRGMTPETKARLFEPFFTTKGQGKGTGLGLAIVYGIVKQTGGRIGVYSEPGAGTTFQVFCRRDASAHVPRRRVADGRPRARDGAAGRGRAGRARMTAAALERHGYTVLAAASGAEALRSRARTAAIHLLLTDVVMPGMSGPQLVERLRGEQPDLAALFMSGYTMATR